MYTLPARRTRRRKEGVQLIIGHSIFTLLVRRTSRTLLQGRSGALTTGRLSASTGEEGAVKALHTRARSPRRRYLIHSGRLTPPRCGLLARRKRDTSSRIYALLDIRYPRGQICCFVLPCDLAIGVVPSSFVIFKVARRSLVFCHRQENVAPDCC